MTSIITSPIDVGRVFESLGTRESGGLTVFVGTVRDHSDGKAVNRLEYSAYVPMAEKQMAAIECEVRERWPVQNVICIHRIGMLEIGDVAVVTAVAAAHRDVAFAACRHAIDRIKELVPIWKKEYAADGTFWVEGRHDSAGRQ
jgi:molybdopterin synthase catalytic subunit